MCQAEQGGLRRIRFPEAKPQHEMRKDNSAEDQLLHERIEELSDEIEQGEEESTHHCGLLVDRRKQDYQAEHPNEKGLVEVPSVKSDGTDRLSEHPEIPQYQKQSKHS